MTNEIKLIAKPTLDPNVYEFELPTSVFPSKAIVINRDHLVDFSLVQALFANQAISQLSFQNDLIIIRKASDTPWLALTQKIAKAIRDHWPISLEQLISELENKVQNNPVIDDCNIDKIQALIDKTINPQIASHSGYIKAMKVEHSTLYVEMSGGCQGCSQSTQTLQHGVKQVIQRHFPDLKEVADITDHDAGTTPYYE